MLSNSRTLGIIQAQRGIAALYVAIYHTYLILMEPQYGGHVVFQGVARHGFLGVAFFFVLSGFIISLAHANDIGSAGSLLLYMRKRFERVYPVYWVYLTGYIVASYIGLGHPDFSWSPLNILSSYALLPLKSDASLPLKVAWTLVHEVTFYFAFAILLLSARFGYFVFLFWFAALLFNFFLRFSPESIILSHWNLYFFAGILGYVIYIKIPERYGLAFILLGFLLLVVYVYLSSDVLRIRDLQSAENFYLHLLLIPSFLLIISGSALFEARHSFSVPRVFRFFGDASYSIYLVHSAAISLLVIFGIKLGLIDFFGSDVFFLLCCIGSVAAGALAYVLIEGPMVGFLKRKRTG